MEVPDCSIPFTLLYDRSCGDRFSFGKEHGSISLHSLFFLYDWPYNLFLDDQTFIARYISFFWKMIYTFQRLAMRVLANKNSFTHRSFNRCFLIFILHDIPVFLSFLVEV